MLRFRCRIKIPTENRFFHKAMNLGSAEELSPFDFIPDSLQQREIIKGGRRFGKSPVGSLRSVGGYDLGPEQLD